VREKFVVNGFGGFHRIDLHFFDWKSNIAIVAGISGQRRTTGAKFHREEIRRGRNGNSETFAKITLRQLAFGLLRRQKLLHVIIEPVVRQAKFPGHFDG